VAPVIVVSSGSHVGPRIKKDLRPYCPAAYLNEFDALQTSTPVLEGAPL
jgi:hypothetical protein